MKRSLLIISLCLVSLANQSYGQTQATSKESVPVAVSSNAELSQKRAELDAKQSQVIQSTTSSRAQMKQLNEELSLIKVAYIQLLVIESEKSTNEQIKAELKEEIARFSTIEVPQNR